MHSLRTIIRINEKAAEPSRSDTASQARWVLSLLTLSERSLFVTSGRLPEVQRKFAASRGINVPLLEINSLELLKWKSPQH